MSISNSHGWESTRSCGSVSDFKYICEYSKLFLVHYADVSQDSANNSKISMPEIASQGRLQNNRAIYSKEVKVKSCQRSQHSKSSTKGTSKKQKSSLRPIAFSKSFKR